MSRGAKLLVVLTALLCLGVGGYAGQIGWARHIAGKFGNSLGYMSAGKFMGSGLGIPKHAAAALVFYWKSMPWYGEFYSGKELHLPFWTPRRTYYELVKASSGADLGNDPLAWESWFSAHPNLKWNENQHRLVETAKP